MAAGRGCSNGILGRPAGPRTGASAEAASLGAAGRGISRQCPSRHVLLGRTDQVAVAVTGSLRLAPRSLRRQHQTETPPTLFTGRISPAMPTRSALGRCRASAIRLRAQRLEVLPNSPASLRSDSGLPVWRLAR